MDHKAGTGIFFTEPGGYDPHHTLMPAFTGKYRRITLLFRQLFKHFHRLSKDPLLHRLPLPVQGAQLPGQFFCPDCILRQQQFRRQFRPPHTAGRVDPRREHKTHLDRRNGFVRQAALCQQGMDPNQTAAAQTLQTPVYDGSVLIAHLHYIGYRTNGRQRRITLKQRLLLLRFPQRQYQLQCHAYTGQVLSGPANVKLSAPVNQSGDIGMEAAKSAALKHAGLSSATFTKAERDYDDGRWEYELEFHTDTAAYEVTVDAISGSVLDYEKENLRSSSTSDIGAQAAKSAALRHAGLSEGQVQELQVEWDNEHGRAVYEVEFKSGGMEYEYVIDAATGSVLEHQAEQDD